MREEVVAFPGYTNLLDRHRYIDLEALSSTPLGPGPFPYVIVPGFLPAAARAAIAVDFPKIPGPGSFPAADLAIGPVFDSFLAELQGPAFRSAMERKFAIDLTDRPVTITVRGQARTKDGRIHNDSRSKLITVLIYMNESWEAEGGRLRLLRSPSDLDDVIAEVPPQAGTLLAFRVTRNSWHGHRAVNGPRRVIQLNWVESEAVARRERTRHGISARIKRVLAPWI